MLSFIPSAVTIQRLDLRALNNPALTAHDAYVIRWIVTTSLLWVIIFNLRMTGLSLFLLSLPFLHTTFGEIQESRYAPAQRAPEKDEFHGIWHMEEHSRGKPRQGVGNQISHWPWIQRWGHTKGNRNWAQILWIRVASNRHRMVQRQSFVFVWGLRLKV